MAGAKKKKSLVRKTKKKYVAKKKHMTKKKATKKKKPAAASSKKRARDLEASAAAAERIAMELYEVEKKRATGANRNLDTLLRSKPAMTSVAELAAMERAQTRSPSSSVGTGLQIGAGVLGAALLVGGGIAAYNKRDRLAHHKQALVSRARIGAARIGGHASVGMGKVAGAASSAADRVNRFVYGGHQDSDSAMGGGFNEGI